jgi:hypothetical protein
MRTAVLQGILTAIVLAMLSPGTGRAATNEVFRSITIDGEVYREVRVVEATPVEVAIVARGPVGRRLKRQELPPELACRYPYDPARAAEFEQEQARVAVEKQARDRREAYESLGRQERGLLLEIKKAEEDLARTQKEINLRRPSAQGRPRSVARMSLEHTRDRRLNVFQHLEHLKQQLDSVRLLKAQFR